MSEDLTLGNERRRDRRDGRFGGIDDIDSSLLFFFLILVMIFTNCGDSFGGVGDCDNDSSLLFFFLILVILFCGDDFLF